MSVAFAEPVLDRPAADVQAVPSPARVRPKPRRSGPGVGPTSRPRRLRFAGDAAARPGVGARACKPTPLVQRSRTWRLTDRGLAVVLVVAAALVAASIAVVGLTALRVTSESYQPSHSAVAAPVLPAP